MTEPTPDGAQVPPRLKPTCPFCWQGKELYDIFLPIMGVDSFAIYAYFTGIEFSNSKLTHSIRSIAKATGIGAATVSRSLEILESLRLIKLFRFPGSRDSECQLLDSKAVAIALGAQYHRKTVSYSLPPKVTERLNAKVKAIREKQQGKSPATAPHSAPYACVNLPFRVSHRNAGVSPEKRQRTTRETQRGSHLIQEERRIEEAPSPTPSLSSETKSDKDTARQSKDSPDEDEPGSLMKWAVAVFTGVINELGDHLLDTSRPPIPHLANGAEEWTKFGFGSLAVEAAEWRGENLALTLSASDPEATQLGLRKYHRIFDACLRKWYRCEVEKAPVKAQSEVWRYMTMQPLAKK